MGLYFSKMVGDSFTYCYFFPVAIGWVPNMRGRRRRKGRLRRATGLLGNDVWGHVRESDERMIEDWWKIDRRIEECWEVQGGG